MLIAQRLSQVHDIDYAETFVYTNRRESLRIFLAIATMIEMIILQMDVISVYLKSVLS